MAASAKKPDSDVSTLKKRRRRPAQSLESRENQLILQAMDYAEKEMGEGNASSQIVTHFLKLGTTRQQLEKAKIEGEVALAAAKTEALESSKRIEELYADAIVAMRAYQGAPVAPTTHED